MASLLFLKKSWHAYCIQINGNHCLRNLTPLKYMPLKWWTTFNTLALYSGRMLTWWNILHIFLKINKFIKVTVDRLTDPDVHTLHPFSITLDWLIPSHLSLLIVLQLGKICACLLLHVLIDWSTSFKLSHASVPDIFKGPLEHLNGSFCYLFSCSSLKQASLTLGWRLHFREYTPAFLCNLVPQNNHFHSFCMSMI